MDCGRKVSVRAPTDSADIVHHENVRPCGVGKNSISGFNSECLAFGGTGNCKIFFDLIWMKIPILSTVEIVNENSEVVM